MSKQVISDDMWKNQIRPAVGSGDLNKIISIYKANDLSYSAVGGGDKRNVLHRAARSGKLDIVKYCVEAGVELDSRRSGGRSDGYTAMIFAARSGHVEVVSYLREQGASVECETSMSGRTALRLAAHGNFLPVAYYLLDVQEDMLSAGFREEELKRAAYKGETEAVRYLVEEGLKVECRQTYKDASVVRTAERGYLDAVKFLVSSGAKVNSKDVQGVTALGTALKKRKAEVAAYLCSLPDKRAEVGDFDPESRYENGHTVFIWAATTGEISIVKYLTEKYDVDMKEHLCSYPDTTVSSLEEFDHLTSVLDKLYGADQGNDKDETYGEENNLDSVLNNMLARFIDNSPDVASDPSQICIFYRGTLYKSLIRLYLEIENLQVDLDPRIVLQTIYIALQAKQRCEDSKKKMLKNGLGDELYVRFKTEIEKVRGNSDDHRMIADKIYTEYIKENKGCIENVKSCLVSCWKGTKRCFQRCHEKVKNCLCSPKDGDNMEKKKSDKGGCLPPELYHKCKARGTFALVSCTLAVVFYILDLYSDIIVGYDDYTGFSEKLGIFEMVLVGFTWVHENIRSSISQYSTEEELLKVALGKQQIELLDWVNSDLNKSSSRIKQFFFMICWPFAVRRQSGCAQNFKAVLFNLLTILQLRPVVDRLRVLLHSPTSLRAFYRHQTEQNSLKQFYLITEQIPELMIQFYTLQIVFNLGNHHSNEQQIYSDCDTNRSFSYDNFNDGLNNTNSFCEELSLSAIGTVNCGILFRIFSLMMPFLMIPSGIVSLEDGFRVLDPVTPNMPITIKYLLQAGYSLMLPARVFMFAVLMHSVSTKEIIFGYIVSRAAMELVINLIDIKTLRKYFMSPEDSMKAKKRIASKNRADFIEQHGTLRWYAKNINFYMRHVFLDYGGALWRISMFSVRDVFAVSVRDPQAYMSNSSNVSYDSLRNGKSVIKRAVVFLLEGLVGALVIEQYYPCGKESEIFRYIGWICLTALVLSVTLMSLISDLLNPQLLKSAEQYFLTKSLKISGGGFLLGCFVSLVFSRSQLRTPAELWAVFWMMTIYLVICGVVILVIMRSAVTSTKTEKQPPKNSCPMLCCGTRGNESERKSAKICILSCCQTSEKIELATKLDSGPICCILICCPRHQERELETKLDEPPSQERITDQDSNSTCAGNDSPSGSDLSENQEKEELITPCPEDKTEAESQVQKEDTVSQSCCLPFCLHHPYEPVYSKVSSEPAEKTFQKKSILQRIKHFKSYGSSETGDIELGERGQHETCDPANSDIEPDDVSNVQDQTASKEPEPETSPIHIPPVHVSPEGNSSRGGHRVSNPQQSKSSDARTLQKDDIERGQIEKDETCDAVNSDNIEPHEVTIVTDQTVSKGPDPEISPSQMDIDILPDHVSPEENSSSREHGVSDSQC